MKLHTISHRLFPKDGHMTKSLLIQYLISYIIILFIPLIVLVLFIQLRFQSALISELQTNSRQSLSALAIKTEQKIETYQRISQQMSINEYFYSPLDPSKPEDYLEVKEEMNSYAATVSTAAPTISPGLPLRPGSWLS